MPTALEREFHREMVNIYNRAQNEANYVATRFIQMVAEHGGLATAKILINTAIPSEGYTTLWEKGRLDLTVEALVAEDPRWKVLFSPDEIEKAKQRLREYGHNIV